MPSHNARTYSPAPHDTRRIVEVDNPVILRVQLPELLGKRSESLLRQPAIHLLAQRFVGLRQVVHAFAQRPDIQPRAADGNDVIVAGKKFFEPRKGLHLVFPATQVILYIVRGNKMMLNRLKLIESGLCRADRHPPVNLPGIGRKDRSGVMAGQTDAQIRFARTRRPDDDQQPFSTHRRNYRRPRNR